MPDKGQRYEHAVVNIAGYVVEFPNVENMAELRGLNSEPDPYATSADPLFPMGTKAIQGESIFRYCKNGATELAIAAPIQQAKRAHAEQDDDIVVGAVAAIGATSVELVSTALLDTAPNNIANDFAEGYMIVNDVVGQGQMYKIRANELFAGTALSTFELYDGLTIALGTCSEVGLIRNPYYKVIATEAPVSGMAIGVPLLVVPANHYFWAKSGGPAPVVAQEAITLGTPVVVGVTAAKVNEHNPSSTGELIIGYPQTPGVEDTEQFICFLTLDR